MEFLSFAPTITLWTPFILNFRIFWKDCNFGTNFNFTVLASENLAYRLSTTRDLFRVFWSYT